MPLTHGPLENQATVPEGDMMAKKKQKKVRVNPHVPVKLATTAATSVDRKAEAVRRPKIFHGRLHCEVSLKQSGIDAWRFPSQQALLLLDRSQDVSEVVEARCLGHDQWDDEVIL